MRHKIVQFDPFVAKIEGSIAIRCLPEELGGIGFFRSYGQGWFKLCRGIYMHGGQFKADPEQILMRVSVMRRISIFEHGVFEIVEEQR